MNPGIYLGVDLGMDPVTDLCTDSGTTSARTLSQTTVLRLARTPAQTPTRTQAQISCDVEPKEVAYACPGDVELRDVVRGLQNGRAGGTSGIRAETIKGWLRGMEREEKEEDGNTGAGDA